MKVSREETALEGLAAAALLIETEVANLRWFAREMIALDPNEAAGGTMPRYVLEINGSPDVITRVAAYAELAAAVPYERLVGALAASLAARGPAKEGAFLACGSVDDPTRRALYLGAILAYESVELNDEGRQLDVSALIDAIPQPQRGEVLRMLEFLAALNNYFGTRRNRALDS